MEFVTLENSCLTEQDFLLTEIKQETADEVWDLYTVNRKKRGSKFDIITLEKHARFL